MLTRRLTGRDGLELVADVAGPADCTPVVLLHGRGQTRHSWGTALRALARRGYRAIALDARGHGDSDWAPDGDYALAAFAADLAEVIAPLPRPPAIVGASLGGLTGLVAVGLGSVPARALVLVDIVPKVDRQGVSRIGRFMGAHPQGFANAEEAAASVAAYLPHRERPRDVSGLRRNLREGADGRLYWHWDPGMLLAQGDNPDVAQALVESAAVHVRVPTLLIRGEHSEIVSADSVRAFQATIPHAEYVEVAGARHMVAGDENSAFNAALIEFLVRTAPPIP
ncbi:MAG: alpha/beta fold hydrolase [Betaproteobacteria bacterium]